MAYILDLKDKKILSELDFDARQSYSELGRKIRLSKQVVEYRVNNLIKQGIIKGFYAVVNSPKLGYIYCRLSLTLQNISPEEQLKMLEDINQHPHVFWVFSMQGDFDIFFGIWTRSLTEFKNFVDEFMIKYSRYIKKKVENIATDVIHYQHRYLLGKKETRELHIQETDKRVQIDDLDKEILHLLCENARISLVDMGKRIKQHPKTLAYRISRMEKIKLIEAYRAGIDHNVLGYTYYKIFLNISNFTREELTRLKEYIRMHPATIYLIEGVSLHGDLDFEMMIKDNRELYDFINLLRKEFPKIVGNYNTVIFMDTLKVRYLPF